MIVEMGARTRTYDSFWRRRQGLQWGADDMLLPNEIHWNPRIMCTFESKMMTAHAVALAATSEAESAYI